MRIRWETGGGETYTFEFAGLRALETAELRGQRFEKRWAPLPSRMPLGYHELHVSDGTVTSVTRLIVGPERAYLSAGLGRGRARRGCGGQSVRAPFEAGIGAAAISATWSESWTGWPKISAAPASRSIRCMRFTTGSPSIPARICRTPSSTAIPSTWTSSGWRISASLRRRRLFLRQPGTQSAIAALRASEFVEYEGVYALKLRFLRLCFETFLQHRRGAARTSRSTAAAKASSSIAMRRTAPSTSGFIRRIPMSGCGRTGLRSTATPNRKPRAVSREAHREEILFHKYVQWQLDRQLGGVQQYALEKGLSIGLYHDLALATDRCGSDQWAYPEHFVAGCRVGAPPDGFSPKGQDWGFPPPNTEHHHEDGYRLFAEIVRHNCRHGGALRIDHVMRFFRLFWIPDGMEAVDGTYVRDYPEDLLRILALESVRNQVHDRRRRPGHGGAGVSRDTGPLRNPELPAAVLRAPPERRVSPAAGVSPAGAGVVHHA